MQDFIESIYRDSLSLDYLYEAVESISRGSYENFLINWAMASERIETIIVNLGNDGKIDEARIVLEAWKTVRESGDDIRLSCAMIKEKLIPILENYIKELSDIDVTEGKWRLKSSSHGFLTLRDEEQSAYIHDPYDPMREATILAKALFNPEKGIYHILGSGLGYLPYCLYALSEKTATIYVYEDDKCISVYAREFGVLDWIECENLVIVNGTSEEIIDSFIRNIENDKSSVWYIQDWKHYTTEKNAAIIADLALNSRTERECERVWKINCLNNRKIDSKPVSDLIKRMRCDNCLVLGAGPSLDDNFEYVKQFHEKNKNGLIISVNTALRKLEVHGIKPDIVVALDPAPSLLTHLTGIESFTEGIPLVSNIKASNAYWTRYRGPIYRFRTRFVNGNKFYDDEDAGEPWNVGGTVSSLALEAAFRIGAKEIRLIGIDLAYPGGKNHANETTFDNRDRKDDTLMVRANDGSEVPSNQEFVFYRRIIEEQIRSHRGIRVINMSKYGAFIEGTSAK